MIPRPLIAQFGARLPDGLYSRAAELIFPDEAASPVALRVPARPETRIDTKWTRVKQETTDDE